MTATLDELVKAYDVRGQESALTEEVAYAFGVAAAIELVPTDGKLVVGRDMRPSSPTLAAAFARGAARQGVDVIDIGLTSTDGLYFASGTFNAAGAMFTASHNPAGYNGIKMCRPAAVPVAIDTGLATIRDLAKLALAKEPPPAATDPGTVTSRDITTEFAAHVRSFIDLDALEPVRVVVDAGNGMAGHLWPQVVEHTAIDTHALYFELDGTFPNHPANPLEPENLRDLQTQVAQGDYALGLAFDGDADRVFAVDETGAPVSSSLIGAVVADRLLAENPGATVLYNLICSDTVRETIEAAGGNAVRTRVGHSYIKADMAETGAVYAVEHSGHFYFADNYRADSGMIAALVLLEVVARAGKPLSEVVAPYDRYAASGEVNIEVADTDDAIAAVAAAYASAGEADYTDGLTVRTDAGWFNLRASNTEPLLRLNVEAPDTAQMEALRDEVLEALGS